MEIFFENLTLIEILSRIWLQSKYLEIFEKTRNFSKILTKIGILSKIWLESTYLEIFEKLEIIRKFLPKSKFFENFDQNRLS